LTTSDVDIGWWLTQKPPCKADLPLIYRYRRHRHHHQFRLTTTYSSAGMPRCRDSMPLQNRCHRQSPLHLSLQCQWKDKFIYTSCACFSTTSTFLINENWLPPKHTIA
jgi:hypothetical protein